MLNYDECLANKEIFDKYQSWINPALAHHIYHKYINNLISGRILDLGTGPGYLSKYLSSYVNNKIIAVDYNPFMLTIANESLSGIDNVELLYADVHNLDFPDNFFDLIISYSCFHHWENPVVGIGECYRVLRPRGVLLLIDSLKNEINLSFLRRSIEEENLFLILEKAINESLDFEQVNNFFSLSDFNKWDVSYFKIDRESIISSINFIKKTNLMSKEDLGETTFLVRAVK